MMDRTLIPWLVGLCLCIPCFGSPPVASDGDTAGEPASIRHEPVPLHLCRLPGIVGCDGARYEVVVTQSLAKDEGANAVEKLTATAEIQVERGRREAFGAAGQPVLQMRLLFTGLTFSSGSSRATARELSAGEHVDVTVCTTPDRGIEVRDIGPSSEAGAAWRGEAKKLATIVANSILVAHPTLSDVWLAPGSVWMSPFMRKQDQHLSKFVEFDRASDEAVIQIMLPPERVEDAVAFAGTARIAANGGLIKLHISIDTGTVRRTIDVKPIPKEAMRREIPNSEPASGIAHELGHGQGLAHTLSDAANLMHDYASSPWCLREGQWDDLNPSSPPAVPKNASPGM